MRLTRDFVGIRSPFLFFEVVPEKHRTDDDLALPVPRSGASGLTPTKLELHPMSFPISACRLRPLEVLPLSDPDCTEQLDRIIWSLDPETLCILPKGVLQLGTEFKVSGRCVCTSAL